MLKNYLQVAIRNLLKFKMYSLINVSGLALGIACCIFILLFVRDEFQYDGHHKNRDLIYRVLWRNQTGDGEPQYKNTTPGALGDAIKADVPEVVDAVRVFKRRTWITIDDKTFEPEVCLADPTIFDVFTYPIIRGDAHNLATTPYSILVTETMAKNYWGDSDPIGKMISIDRGFFQGDYTVTGVLKDLPRTTTYGLRFDCLTTTVAPNLADRWNNWHRQSYWNTIWTYVLVPDIKSIETLETKLKGITAQYLGNEVSQLHSFHLQPLNRVHLYSKADYGMYSDGDIDLIYTLALVALFVLGIACINFMNLATARSEHRAREIGMRKVVGAKQAQIIWQFLGESVLLALVSLIFALMLVEFTLPIFNNFARTDGASKELALNFLQEGYLIIGLLGITLLVGVFAGSYPAFFLSRFQPVDVLKGKSKKGRQQGLVRNGLVVFQFMIAISFLIGVIVVHKQVDFLIHKNLGYNTAHLIRIPIFDRDRSLASRSETVIQAFLRHPNVLKASTYSTDIISGSRLHDVRAEGQKGVRWQMRMMGVDEYFLETFEISLLAGQNLKTREEGFILNETAVQQLGWTDPIGKQIEWISGERKGPVVGVVKNFHNRPLYEAIGPVALYMRAPRFTGFTVRIRGSDMTETLAFLEETWNQFVPHVPFTYYFHEDRLLQTYRSEVKLKHILSVGSGLSIFVACLGLLGLATFLVTQRTKEIGIRRVLGASPTQIFRLLSEAFLKPILLAGVFAGPLTYMLLNSWLQNFAFRIHLGFGIFVSGGLCVFIIALGTVFVQAIRASKRNPVEALRCE